jgi:CHAT domain-containing protein
MTRFAYGSSMGRGERYVRYSALQLQRERVVLESSMTAADEFLQSRQLLAAVRQAQPAGSVLLEYLVYDKPVVRHEGTRLTNEPERRYLGIMIGGAEPVVARDLGPAAEIDRLVAGVCESLFRSAPSAALAKRCAAGTPRPPGTPPARAVLLAALSERLLDPFRKGIGPTAMVIVAPDGALNFLPFELLTDTPGRFLVEKHVVTYVSSARDLVRAAKYMPSQTAPAIVGDPAFGSDLQDCEETRASGPAAFLRLCAAAREVEQLQRIMPDAVVFRRDAASEEAVKTLRGPRVLHFNTHGFAYQASELPSVDSPNCIAVGDRLNPEVRCSKWTIPEWDVIVGDPLVRAGVALAGINRGRSPEEREDGRLSAAEASLLDLTGTQLVVVSACETGLGEATAGEGVVGFRRAFAIAGARAQTFSLWKVRDTDAADFMREYYQLLMSGMGNAEALATVKRALIEKRVDPARWAVFVSYGYPGPLGR